MRLLIYFALLKLVIAYEFIRKCHFSCTPPEKVQELKVQMNNKAFILNKKFTSLVNLEITGCCLEEFHGIDSSSKLSIFSVNGGHLNELNGSTFGNLTALRKLFLKMDFIHVVKDGVFNEWKNISHIYLQDNSIKIIHSEAFPQNCGLKVLNLSNNSIENVDFLKNLKELKRLHLSSNKILKINIEMENLQVLDLKNNFLKQLNFLESLPRLEKVDLSSNKIEELPLNFLGKSKLLLELHLSNNFIKFIQSGTFQDMEKLKILDLSYNHIEFIGEIFHAFKSTYIHLNNNLLTHISLENKNLTLTIDDNPWSCTYLQELSPNFNVTFNYTFNNSTSNFNGIKCTNSSVPHKNSTNIVNNPEKLIMNVSILIVSIFALIAFLILINIYDYKKCKVKPDKKSEITLRMATTLPGYLTPTSLNDEVICENNLYIPSEQRDVVI